MRTPGAQLDLQAAISTMHLMQKSNKNDTAISEGSVSGTSGGRRITNIRGPLSDVIEAAATITHNLHFETLVEAIIDTPWL